MTGRFITLEGGEGAGKSTCMKAAVKVLAAAGIESIQTREPGGTPLAERIRGILLDNAAAGMPPLTELLLVFAARHEHLERVVIPALEAGTWVVCDRYVDASYAYQGAGRGIPTERIATLERWLPRLGRRRLEPDLTLLLDVPAPVGIRRATRNRGADRFEIEQREFYERVRADYLARARDNPRFAVIDAARDLSKVVGTVRARMRRFVAEHGPEDAR